MSPASGEQRMATMRKALLLYNPHSGRRRARREHDIKLALAELRSAGVEASAEPTRAAGSAGEQARAAVSSGFDTVIACGGDGTVHDVLQGIVGLPVQLAVLPLGTGNALANDLGLPREVRAAARKLAAAQPQPVAVGTATSTRDGAPLSRVFLVGAGVGADAHMVYRLSAAFKQRFGMFSYYAESTRQWATHSFPEFEVEFRDLGSGEMRRGPATQVLAIRIANFGGLLRRLAPGAALQRNDLRLVLFRTRSRSRYLRYMASVLCGQEPKVADVEFAYTDLVRCSAPADAAGSPRIYGEADGELLGTLPITLELTGATVPLLFP